jgi:twitching motility protein PilT
MGKSNSMQSMDQHLMQLIKEDKITQEAAHEKAIDKKLFSGGVSQTEQEVVGIEEKPD